MKHLNKGCINLEEKQIDALLRQALTCTEKPSSQLKKQLLGALQSGAANRRGSRGISLWWLPAVSGTLFFLTVFAVAPFFLSCFPIILLCVRIAALLFCADTWFATLIGLKLFDLREAALL